MAIPENFGTKPILKREEVRQVLPKGAILMDDLHTKLVQLAIGGEAKDEPEAQLVATTICRSLRNSSEFSEEECRPPFISMVACLSPDDRPELVEFLTDDFTKAVLEAQTDEELYERVGFSGNYIVVLKPAVEGLVGVPLKQEKELFTFSGLIDRVIDRFVEWDAYEGLKSLRGEKLWAEQDKSRDVHYALEKVVDIVIDEAVHEEGMRSFYEAMCGRLREEGDQERLGLLENLGEWLDLIPSEGYVLKDFPSRAHESAEILVKAVAVMKVVGILSEVKEVTDLCMVRFDRYWGMKLDAILM